MILRAIAAIAILAAGCAAPRPAQVSSPTGLSAPAVADDPPARTGAPLGTHPVRDVATPTAADSGDGSRPSAAPHLIPPLCSGPCPTAIPPPVRSRLAHVVKGNATWYRWHVGEAAAGPALRAALGSHWRGSRVRVCAGIRCVSVVLSDFCACNDHRVVDLDVRSFARLADPSRGVLAVVVAW